eukprot:CAMPEP_0119523870 /NCGR_PEP_ID=MMETSP1344-20130328/38875_1 /TAXON_ID=236787 /ORGANISM="Florenciella parvula, Strain CCMP2471" /LENGTH=163 /DNA_ID=CAMNT_0007562221 /DNA_START=111 /DNA_END=601 /DNA_ORIENTATION=-
MTVDTGIVEWVEAERELQRSSVVPPSATSARSATPALAAKVEGCGGAQKKKGKGKGKGKGAKAGKAEQARLDKAAAPALAVAVEAEAAAKVGRGDEGAGDGRQEHPTGGHNFECAICGSNDGDLFPCSYCNLTWRGECLSEERGKSVKIEVSRCPPYPAPAWR